MPRALSALLIGVLLLTARAPGSALAQMPPPDDPPYKHFLSTDEEKRVTDQGKKINELLAADKCAEALCQATIEMSSFS